MNSTALFVNVLAFIPAVVFSYESDKCISNFVIFFKVIALLGQLNIFIFNLHCTLVGMEIYGINRNWTGSGLGSIRKKIWGNKR